MSRQACSDGETIYHVDDRRRSPRIRHTLRAVRTEFREIVTVGEQEAALAGFRSNGIESARDHFRNAWEDRHGTPWGGWAWLTWFEADASDSPVKRRWTNRRALAGEAPADESPRGGHPGPFGGPGYAPAAPKRAAARDHDVRYLLGRCANGAERDGGRVRHAVRDHRALCEAAPGRRSAGWSPHQADDCVTCRQCLKKLAAEDREKMQTDRSKRS